MSETALPAFQKVQRAFLDYLRNPEKAPPLDDIPLDRLNLYRRLTYNSTSEFISNALPTFRKLLSQARWQALTQDFFSMPRMHSPLSQDIAGAFITYLQENYQAEADDPACLLEVAHFEWTQYALRADVAEVDWEAQPALIDPLNTVFALSPLARPFGYRFPVHQMTVENCQNAPPEAPTYLVAARNRDDKVTTTALNAVTARLIQLLTGQAQRGEQLLKQIAAELQQDTDRVLQEGASMLHTLYDKDILITDQSST